MKTAISSLVMVGASAWTHNNPNGNAASYSGVSSQQATAWPRPSQNSVSAPHAHYTALQSQYWPKPNNTNYDIQAARQSRNIRGTTYGSRGSQYAAVQDQYWPKPGQEKKTEEVAEKVNYGYGRRVTGYGQRAQPAQPRYGRQERQQYKPQPKRSSGFNFGSSGRSGRGRTPAFMGF